MYKRKPTQTQINSLLNLYADNAQQHEQMGVKQNNLIQSKKMAKAFKEVQTKVTKEFKNEVENDYEEINFWDFEEKKVFTGVMFGETKTIKTKDKTSECFIVVDEDEQKWLLPTNVQLTSKVSNLLKIKEAEKSIGIDLQITNEGLQKIEGVDNKVKVFKVLTT
jgi:hypothetical protein